jgi:hypothetical protein
MRKLPLAWFAVEAIVFVLAVSGCALGGRQSFSAHRLPAGQSAVPVRTAERTSSIPEPSLAKNSEDLTEDNSACQVARSAQQPILPIPSKADAKIQSTDWNPDGGADEWDAGVYIGGGSTIHNYPAALGSIGLTTLPTPWTTLRFGLMGADIGGIGVGGIELGARVHAPTRFSPYMGISGDLGLSGLHTGHISGGMASNTPRYNVSVPSGLAAFVPEGGVSYWLTPTTRLNAGVSYFIPATQPEFLLCGVSMEYIFTNGPAFKYTSANPPRRVARDQPDGEDDDPYFVDLKGAGDPMDLIRERVAKRARKNGSRPELNEPDDEASQLDPVPANPPQ